MSISNARTVAIVGAGYSGTLLAINLLRAAARPTRVVLVERSGSIARGAAYARRDFPYILNVPASHMSATGSDPDEFLHYVQRFLPTTRGEDFISREMYGNYLEQLLEAAVGAARPGVSFEHRTGSVLDVREPKRPELLFADGTRLAADEVVLALGNPPAADPCPAPGMMGIPGVRPDPWTRIEGSDPARPLLVIGSGLTMADVVCDTVARSPGRPIHVLSRHGLIPPDQTNFQRAPAHLATHPLEPTPSLRRLVASARGLVREIEVRGGDWRTAIATIRSAAPRLWRALPPAERRRFLRHVRSHWDSLRHRLPGSVRARVVALHARGQLKLHAGRLVSVTREGDELVARWQPRGQTLVRELRAGEVANCTGPDYDIRRSTEPLWQALVARGDAVGDELGLGVRTATHGALLDHHGHAHHHLYYVGPMLRADHWEATAAAELRDRIEALARFLIVQDRAPR